MCNFEDNAIRALASVGSDQASTKSAELLLDQAIGEYKPLVGKAWWAYTYASKRCSLQPISSVDNFARVYLGAWECFLRNAAKTMSGSNPAVGNLIRLAPNTLVVTSHFPEYPLMLTAARDNGALVLITRSDSWIAEYLGEENTYCFTEGRLSSRLLRAFATGRPIVAAMDYCYSQSRNRTCPFLGSLARSPIGVLELAERFGFHVYGVSAFASNIEMSDFSFTGSEAVDHWMSAINQWLGLSISRRAGEWLLWPSVDRRWLNVNYNE